MTDVIECTECGTKIEISQALSSQLTDRLSKEFAQKQRERDKKYALREAELRGLKAAIGKERESLEQQIAERLIAERKKVRQQEAVRAKAELAIVLKDKDEELAGAKEKIQKAQAAELEMRKKARELEEQQREFDLTLARRLDEERAKIRDVAKKEADQERQLKDAEKDKLIGDMKRQIDDLKRKSEQGSQQLQGEVMELTLEDQLNRTFPHDKIVPVPKGVHGADVLQEVREASGQLCGTILWESKRTKNWKNEWLPKLRHDQREAKAQLAILVSIELPKDVDTFKRIDGVWVTSWSCSVALVDTLRAFLIEVARAKVASDGQQDKMELLYSYLTGQDFRHRVEGIVEALSDLKKELEAEKRAMNKLWAKREKQLERAVLQTSGMHGDLSGIIGATLPEIEKLSLTALSRDPSTDMRT